MSHINVYNLLLNMTW